MKPENTEQTHEETLMEEVVEEVFEKDFAGPIASFLNHEAASGLVRSGLMDSLEARHQALTSRVQQHPQRVTMIAGGVLLLLVGLLVPVPTPHVSIGAEPLLAGGPRWFTNSFLHTILVDITLIGLAYYATRSMSLVPSGLQNVMEAVIEYLYSFCESVAGHNARKYSHWALTLFLFIIISNWSGLIPGVGSIGFYHVGAEHGAVEEHDASEEPAPAEEAPAEEQEEGESNEHSMYIPNSSMSRDAAVLNSQVAMADGKVLIVEPASASTNVRAAEEEGHAKFVPLLRPPSADLNFTFAIAIITMVMVQVYGYQALGTSYFTKFFNNTGHGAMRGVNLFVSTLELISEVARILTFAFRLFGNIFAGEVVLATMAFLVTFILPIPFYFLEIFVGAVQSLVFMMLALIFFTVATISHGDEHH
ncbi:MAG: F0F1 ATP synthase subunit A [Caldilineaceae bacterium]|nr:F0F1 ATP synthase subunit A [Caldilineaceae bacterium]